MKNAPLVTVIIPTYNRAHLLSRAIRSVLCQTFQEWELIIVDDGSVDNTEEIVKSFSDPRIRYIRHQANRGSSAARNTGIQMARGKYIAFLDSDDEWLPEKLEKQLNIFENSDDEVGVVYTGAVFIDDENGKQRIKKPRAKGWIFIEELAFNPVGSTSRVMVKRECFDKCGGFDEEMPCHEDWDMWIRLAEQYKFDYVEDPLVRYFEHRGSVSAQADRLIAGHKRLWAKYGIERRERWIRALHYFKLGHRLCYYGAIDTGRKFLLKSLLIRPLQFKYIVAFLLSLFGTNLYRKITFIIMKYLG
jgi:glycosyltransferase involved in cell wall biosynthesis